ncbi:MAG TPA: EamA family transporter [Steroidobacteraceae bacterium]|jgi:inner membrane transporter RhtA|nr:EamA family transporter [Steroidobacteraceae bacterium]
MKPAPSPPIPLPASAAVSHRGERVPPLAFFLVSAVFHYLGPAFAVLLFARIAPLGVAWLRIASAAVVFAAWRQPWRYYRGLKPAARRSVLLLGGVLALMNVCFYLAIDRVPLGTVGAIEFVGPIGLAALGARSARNIAALALAVAGVYLLADVRFSGQPVGFIFAFANCALFVLYIILGHRIAADGGTAGIDRLGVAMLVAMIVAFPIGIRDALPAFPSPTLLAAGIGVGICSSVIPYVCDQLAMARLPRATFALLLSLLPAMASLIGALVLHQIPSAVELTGIGLVIGGVLIHRTRAA